MAQRDAELGETPRLEVFEDVELIASHGRVKGILQELGRGGAKVKAPQPIGELGESVELMMPGGERGDLVLVATIVRSKAAGEHHHIALRFVHMEPHIEQGLHQLIETLLAQESPNTDGRRFPRLAVRVDVRYQTFTELLGTLENISRGGFAMTVAEPLEPNQEVALVIPDSLGEDLLTLRAWVVHQRAGNQQPPTYRVGLAFADMTYERRRLLRELLRMLAQLG